MSQTLNNRPMRPCQSCAEPMAAWPSNRKFCGVCQIVRDDFRRHGKPLKPRKCEVCAETFYPARGGYDRCYCCTDFRGGYREHHPECSQCGKRYRTAFGLTKTCMQCVQKTAANRDHYLKMLRALHAERMADPARLDRARQAEDEHTAEMDKRRAKRKAEATVTPEPAFT